MSGSPRGSCSRAPPAHGTFTLYTSLVDYTNAKVLTEVGAIAVPHGPGRLLLAHPLV